MRWAATVCVLAAALSGCGGGDEGATVRAGQAAGPCPVDAAPTGPLTTEDGGLLVPPVPRPDDWVDPPQEGFDWDGDGNGDVLAFDQAAGEVRVEWAGGSLTVTGVRSDFAGEAGQPLDADGDPFLEQPTESGPPPPEAIEDGAVAPVPAAVADVTGDDVLDLIVVHAGVTSVIVGAGTGAASVSVAESAIGAEVPGWRNPPVTPVDPTGTATDQPAVPYDQATVAPRWDLTGDGVADWVVESHLPRARGPVTAYAGQPCT